MMPTWLLTAWHVLSIASAVIVLVILCWHALYPEIDQPQPSVPEPDIDRRFAEYVQPGDFPNDESD
jgi:hypothetical protein